MYYCSHHFDISHIKDMAVRHFKIIIFALLMLTLILHTRVYLLQVKKLTLKFCEIDMMCDQDSVKSSV